MFYTSIMVYITTDLKKDEEIFSFRHKYSYGSFYDIV